jgi:hypothetical protein
MKPCPHCVGRPNPNLTPIFVFASGEFEGKCATCKGLEMVPGDVESVGSGYGYTIKSSGDVVRFEGPGLSPYEVNLPGLNEYVRRGVLTMLVRAFEAGRRSMASDVRNLLNVRDPR